MSRNKNQAEEFEQDPAGWYREPRAPVEQLFRALDFGDAPLIWDPNCGMGNILDVAKGLGFETIGSDIIDRSPRHRFYRSNFLLATKWPTSPGRMLSIVHNPPYNADTGTAEGMIVKALDVMPFYRLASLVPIEFLASVGRFERLYSKRRPSHVLICSQRPSMPPGAQVQALGDRAFKGGKADFVWIVWTSGGPYRTETIWLDPNPPALPSLGRKRRP